MAVAELPPDHPERAAILLILGNMMHWGPQISLVNRLIEMEGTISDPSRSSHLFQHLADQLELRTSSQFRERFWMAWHCQFSPPRARIRAALAAADSFAEEGEWEEGHSLIIDAVKLLPKISPQFLTRDD